MTAFPEKQCCQKVKHCPTSSPGTALNIEVEMEAKAGLLIPERLEHGVK